MEWAWKVHFWQQDEYGWRRVWEWKSSYSPSDCLDDCHVYCQCPSGTVLRENSCVAEQVTCHCPNGSPATDCTSNGQVGCARCNDGYKGTDCTQCADNYFKHQGQCKQEVQCTCAHGTRGTGCTATEPQKCAGCHPGYQPNAGKTQCDPCVAGSASSDGKKCVTCTNGHVSPNAGQTQCDPCAAGSASSDGKTCVTCPGDKQPNPDQTKCVCPTGSVSSDGKKCAACPVDKQPNPDQTECVDPPCYGSLPAESETGHDLTPNCPSGPGYVRTGCETPQLTESHSGCKSGFGGPQWTWVADASWQPSGHQLYQVRTCCPCATGFTASDSECAATVHLLKKNHQVKVNEKLECATGYWAHMSGKPNLGEPCVLLPPNAAGASSDLPYFTCNSGYYPSHSANADTHYRTCKQGTIPDHASSKSTDLDWECNTGYREHNNTCINDCQEQGSVPDATDLSSTDHQCNCDKDCRNYPQSTCQASRNLDTQGTFRYATAGEGGSQMAEDVLRYAGEDLAHTCQTMPQ